MNIVPLLWTADEDAQLETLAKQGLTARQMSEIIGRSRNSVLGRAYRLGILMTRSNNKDVHIIPRLVKIQAEREVRAMAKQKIIERHKAQKLVNPSKPGVRQSPYFKFDMPPPSIASKPILALGSSRCRYPVQEGERPSDTLFCGLPVENGPYCARCAQLAYIPFRRRA